MGKSIQFGLKFISQYVTSEKMIQDLKAFEIETVHFAISEHWDGGKTELIDEEWMRAIQSAGIKVWLMIPANAFYDSKILNVDGVDKTDWLIQFQTSQTSMVGLYMYSFHHEGFIQYQCNKIERIIENYPFFDGIEFSESYFPEIETIIGKNPNASGFYGDVSPFALEKFFSVFLDNTASPVSFSEIIQDDFLYNKWVEYRVEAIGNFFKQIKETLISKKSPFLFALWMQGASWSEKPLELIREYLGIDTIQLMDIVSPDYVYIQSSARDWGRYPLDYDYIKAYSPIKEAIKAHDENVFIGVQTDYVSYHYSNQSTVPKLTADWLHGYYETAKSLSFDSATAYEYGLSEKLGTWPSKGIWGFLDIGYLEADSTTEAIPVESEIISILVWGSDYWNLAYTSKGLFWFNDIGKHLKLDMKVPTYQYPNVSSPKTAVPFDPQTFFIIDSLGEDWLKIRTKSVYTWMYRPELEDQMSEDEIRVWQELVNGRN